jgi:hypothetical protein
LKTVWLLALTACLPAAAQNRLVGESCVYKLTYLGFSAVTIELAVPETLALDGRTVYRVVARAKTNPFFSAFYSLDNRYETLIDTETGLPLRYTKTIAQKTLSQQMMVTYDQVNGKGTYDGGRFSPALTRTIQSPTHNFFSMIYALRGLTLSEGDTKQLNLDVETEPWVADIVVLGPDAIEAAGKQRDAWKIDIRFRPLETEVRRRHTDILTRRVATSKSHLTFWLDGNSPHSFLKVEFEMSPFNAYAVLMDERP